MAGDLKGFALEKAELFSSRLKEVLSSGQGYLRAQFGLDLGFKPELYPTWVILSSAAAGLLLLLLGLSWGLLPGKRRRSPDTQTGAEPEPAPAAKPVKPAEEQKKRNKKKTADKKPQSNGQPVVAAQEEVKVTESAPKPAPQIKPEKVHEVQAPVQGKKNKKKAKPDVKPVQHVVTHDGKEPDEGAWETKVSNREKKQQRRKDKGPEDSGSPGGLMTLKPSGEPPAAKTAANSKKSRGNHESLHARNAGHGNTASGSVSSSWREDPAVNGGGADISTKIPPQMGAGDVPKWSNVHAASHYRAPAKRQSWAQDTQAWSGMDGLSPVPFSMLGRNTTDPMANSMDMQWGGHQEVDDEWSGFNGMAAVDPSSDWNAPVEHWGNYEEPPVLAAAAPPPKEQPAPSKVSEDEKDAEDPSGAAAKSKKKRKKKKKTEDEAPTTNTAPQELPVQSSKKQNPSISSAQKKPEQTAEPPKPSQKKKVRRET